MSTLVAFHAHPDDESIGSGGMLARSSAGGHRVVLVVATRGERGEIPPGLLRPGETLAERRVAETREAARILGVHRVEFLDYEDSGMAGAGSNDDPACFAAADVDQAALTLASILDEERPDVLTIYDPHGVTGHPDHKQVHRVGVRASQMVFVPRVYEGTMSRGRVQSVIDLAASVGMSTDLIGLDLSTFGSPDEVITTTIDVRPVLALKRRAMAAHASQIAETSPLVSMPSSAFELMWGHESAILRGAPSGFRETTLFPDPA